MANRFYSIVFGTVLAAACVAATGWGLLGAGAAGAQQPPADPLTIKLSALDQAQPTALAAAATSYYSDVVPPQTIRVARRQKCSETGGSQTTYGWKTCQGLSESYQQIYPDACGKIAKVDVVPFDYYVKRVLPREWPSSWHPESLKAGAMAVKTYAWYWVNKGGKYPAAKDICGKPTVDLQGHAVNADMDDTVNSQVYIPEMTPASSTNAAVDAVSQFRMTKGGKIFQASYRASDCSWKPDGYKISQNGSQCLATKGKTWDYILRYYYFSLELNGADKVPVDDRDAGYSRTNTASPFWYSASSGGYEQSFYYGWNTQTDPVRAGTWSTNLSCKGKWKVLVWVPNLRAVTTAASLTHRARYKVMRPGAATEVVIDQAPQANKWVSLGQFHLPDTPAVSVYLPSNTGEATKSTMVGYDAVRFDRVSCETGVTGAAAPRIVVYRWRGRTKISLSAASGSLPLSGRPVELWAKPFGRKSWSLVGVTATNGWGKAAITATPTRHTRYTAVLPARAPYSRGSLTTPVINVKPVVPISLADASIARGTRSAITGRPSPKHRGLRVSLQRKVGSQWATVAKSRLDREGRYRFGWRPPGAGTYYVRACVAAHWDHSANCSGKRRLVVQ